MEGSRSTSTDPPRSDASQHVTHRELDYRFQFLEERIERRHETVLARIDSLGERLSSQIGTLTSEIGRVDRDMRGNFDKLDAKIEAVRSSSEQHRTQIIWTILVLAAGSFIAALAAIWSTNSLIVSSYSAGVSVGGAKAEAPAAAKPPG